ncbi:MAG TPA: glycosyltransferase family 4 protein [Methylomirabilota bacterium]
MRLEFLSSTPPSPAEGSGTWVAIDGVLRGLAIAGHAARLRPLRARSGFHTLDRWRYNREVVRRPPEADVVIGVDLDGFLWAERRSPRLPYAVMLKGIIADELRNERGLVRALLALQARWERRNVHAADRVIVPSRYSASVAAQVYDVSADAIAVVPEPIDLGEWRRRFAAVPPRSTPVPTVLAVARMYPRKRLDDLLHAAHVLRARIPGLRVRIVGAGPQSVRLHRLAGELGLADTVTFLGEISRQALAVEYVGADCFCLPTVQEGFGIVFTEAMAAGLPVVACRAAAVPEVVEDGRTGLLVSPRSPEELAMAMEKVLTSEALRRELGDNGRRRVEALDLPRVAARLLEVLA